MPYNNAPVLPPKEVTGQLSLPLARVKKIINVDDDVNNCSNNAAFVMTMATEMFIQYLTEEGYKIVKSEKRPRKNLQYADLANAVSRIDNLEFLNDTIPRTTTYKKYREQRGADFQPGDSVRATKAAASGQTEISFKSAGPKDIGILLSPEIPNGTIKHTLGGGDVMDVDMDQAVTSGGADDSDPIQEQLAMEMDQALNGR